MSNSSAMSAGVRLVAGRRLPQPGAVQMHRRVPVPSPLHLRAQLAPVRQLAADLALRQLEQQRRGRLCHRLQLGPGQQPVRASDRAPEQPVQPGVRLALMQFEMAGRMPEHGAPATPVGMHPQRRRLGHGAAGQEDRRRFAQKTRRSSSPARPPHRRRRRRPARGPDRSKRADRSAGRGRHRAESGCRQRVGLGSGRPPPQSARSGRDRPPSIAGLRASVATPPE